MLSKTIEAMVEALSKSVSDIHAAGGTGRDELLTKSYSEFREALAVEIDGDLAKRAPAALFKNLGVVGAVANMVNAMGDHVDLLKSAGDELSPDVEELIANAMGYGEAALHQAVNEHCDLADDADLAEGAELPEGVHLIQVPDAEDAESYVVLKTALPGDLAKMAVDPASLQARVAELGIASLQLAGVPDAELSKLFAPVGGELAKTFPPKKTPAAGGDAGGSDGSTTPAGPSQDASGDQTSDQGDGSNVPPPGADPNAGGGQGMDTSGDDPITVAMRIAAALMIQLNQIYEMVNGSDPAAGDGGDAGAGASPDPSSQGAPNPPPSGMGKRAPVQAAPVAADPRVDALLATMEKLSKSTEAALAGQDELAKTVAVVGESMAKVLALPMPPKGQISGAPQGGEVSDSELQKAFDSMSDADRQHLLAKAALRTPERRFAG